MKMMMSVIHREKGLRAHTHTYKTCTRKWCQGNWINSISLDTKVSNTCCNRIKLWFSFSSFCNSSFSSVCTGGTSPYDGMIAARGVVSISETLSLSKYVWAINEIWWAMFANKARDASTMMVCFELNSEIRIPDEWDVLWKKSDDFRKIHVRIRDKCWAATFWFWTSYVKFFKMFKTWSVNIWDVVWTQRVGEQHESSKSSLLSPVDFIGTDDATRDSKYLRFVIFECARIRVIFSWYRWMIRVNFSW